MTDPSNSLARAHGRSPLHDGIGGTAYFTPQVIKNNTMSGGRVYISAKWPLDHEGVVVIDLRTTFSLPLDRFG